MTRPYRFLTTVVHSSSTAVAESPKEASVKSDFVFILAALLCAMVCVIGLIAVAHCAWLRRRSMASDRSPANKGIEKKFVETLPKFAYDSGSEYNGGKVFSGECVICLVEYADKDEIRVLPQCGHGFHIGCIDKWLGSHSSCPSCRQLVVVGKCKTCGENPTVTAGKISLVPEREGRRHSGGSSSINKVGGS